MSTIACNLVQDHNCDNESGSNPSLECHMSITGYDARQDRVVATNSDARQDHNCDHDSVANADNIRKRQRYSPLVPIVEKSNSANSLCSSSLLCLTKAEHSYSLEAIPKDNLNPLERLHLQLGHMSKSNILKLITNDPKLTSFSIHDIGRYNMRPCLSCLQGRMKASPREPTTQHRHGILEKVAMDYKGPFKVHSIHGNTGFILISDYASDFLYVEPVKSKAEAPTVFKRFLRDIATRYNFKVLILQADFDKVTRGKEFNDLLLDLNIRPQRSTPHNHAQNGQVERDIQSLLDKARTFMASSKAPTNLWEYAILLACWFLNRTPTSKNELTTPQELVTQDRPDLRKAIPFLAPGIFHKTKEERHQTPWDYKAEPCRFLGYDPYTKDGYIIISLRTRQILTRSHCIFEPSLLDEPLQDIIDQTTSKEDEDDHYDMFQSLDEDPTAILPTTTSRSSIPEDSDSDDVTDTESLFLVQSSNLATSDTLSTSRWTSDVIALFSGLALPPDPTSLQEALSLPDGPLWKEAFDKEVAQLKDKGTFGEAPQSGHGMKTKIIFKYSFKNDFTLKRKVRIVARGFSQKYGRDYLETYSPTTTVAIVFFLLHLAAVRKLFLASFDVAAAFLEGRNDFEQYAWLPAEVSPTGKPLRVKVIGNWYGQKQAPKIWNDLIDTILVKHMGYTRCPLHPCLYLRSTHSQDYDIITLHVDDGLLLATSPTALQSLLTSLHQHLTKVEADETFTRYLGMEIQRRTDSTNNAIFIDLSL
jgi:hypothetical protein